MTAENSRAIKRLITTSALAGLLGTTLFALTRPVEAGTVDTGTTKIKGNSDVGIAVPLLRIRK
ncbi:MAG: hypothetical protein PHI71_13920 [Acidiphilium sp.]|jgi:hypothetical protein|nr:hypothetical protein [Acidiphilium sp.]